MPGFENQSFMGAIPGEYETKKKGAEVKRRKAKRRKAKRKEQEKRDEKITNRSIGSGVIGIFVYTVGICERQCRDEDIEKE